HRERAEHHGEREHRARPPPARPRTRTRQGDAFHQGCVDRWVRADDGRPTAPPYGRRQARNASSGARGGTTPAAEGAIGSSWYPRFRVAPVSRSVSLLVIGGSGAGRPRGGRKQWLRLATTTTRRAPAGCSSPPSSS